MSIISSSPQTICFAPTNSSTAKQLYSFSKANRFEYMKKPLNENVSYDLPSTFSKRAPSLGYGDRASFIRKNENPPPTNYNIKSDFDKTSPHARAFSFGIAREAYSKVYIKENPPCDKSIPGPGTYTVPPKIGNEARKYTLKGRNSNHLLLTSARQNPGPGAYDPKITIDPNGKYFVGTMKNSCAPSFSLPSLKRFNELKPDGKPGPGAYDLKIGISDSASQFLSTFKSPKTRTYYHSDRKTIDIPKDAIQLPGPGNYRIPSEFGYYESKNNPLWATKKIAKSASQPIL